MSPPSLLPRDAGAMLRLALSLPAIAAYGYLMHQINLPERWALYCLAGVGVGLLVGRWPAIIGGLVALSFLLVDPSPDPFLREVTLFAYLPMAVLSIAAGVGLRRGAGRLTLARPRRQDHGTARTQ